MSNCDMLAPIGFIRRDYWREFPVRNGWTFLSAVTTETVKCCHCPFPARDPQVPLASNVQTDGLTNPEA